MRRTARVAWAAQIQLARQAFIGSHQGTRRCKTRVTTFSMGWQTIMFGTPVNNRPIRLADDPRFEIINPNLPGGDTGIQNPPMGDPFLYQLPNYTRPNLLKAAQHELRTVLQNFPGKQVHFGFFNLTDDEGPGGSPPIYPNELWQWLYKDATTWTDANGATYIALADEFNGIVQPRVSFFQEDLAATRAGTAAAPTPTPPPTLPPSSSGMPNYVTPANTTAYTFSPRSTQIPSFDYYPSPTNDQLIAQYNNGITFQANTPWVSPFMEMDGQKLIKTLNGSPNDGMEAAFNAYLNEYLEIYPQDADQALPPPPLGGPATFDAALWQGELQSWHDYANQLRSFAPIEAPAGLTVARTSATNNSVTWSAVYGATSYKLQHTALPTINWTDVCTSSLTQYSTRNESGDSLRLSRSSLNAACVSLGKCRSDSVRSSIERRLCQYNTPAHPSDPQPGIRAGPTGVAE